MEDEAYRYNTVMLVDDNSTDNFIHRRILEITRFARKIIVTSSVSEALNYLAECSERSGGVPDLIFLDYFMPGLNGADFMSRFGDLPSFIKDHSRVVLLSVLDESMGGSPYDNSLFATFVSKPLTDEKLDALFIAHGVSAQKKA